MSFEFIRNGRRYNLFPFKPPPQLKIVDIDEFINFIDDNISIYIIQDEDPNKKKEEPGKRVNNKKIKS
jgi:hypothetical protein